MKLSLLLAMENIGKPYVWAGNNPMIGLDCSGYVQIILRKLGVITDGVDRTAQQIYDLLSKTLAYVQTPKGDCVIFFGKSASEITHIAITVNAEWMIEAAHGNSHMVLEQQAVDKQAKIEFNRIDRRKDRVACLFLNSPTI